MENAAHRRNTIDAVIHGDGPAHVAECMDLAVVTQGETLGEMVANLRKALALHLEGEDLVALDPAQRPQLELLYHTTIG